MSFATRLLSANPGAQVSSALSGSLTTPGAKSAFVPLNLGSYDALGTVTVLSGGVADITFAGIPQTGYSHLQLRCHLQDNRTTYGIDQLRVQVGNGTIDTGSTSYAYHYFRGDGTTADAAGFPTSSGDNASWQINGAVGTAVSATYWGGIIIDILSYASVTKNKTMKSFSGNDLAGTGPSSVPGRVVLGSGVWLGADALKSITTIKLMPENGTLFSQNSQVSLYGVK